MKPNENGIEEITKNGRKFFVRDLRAPLLKHIKKAYRDFRVTLSLNLYNEKFWGRVRDGKWESGTFSVFDRFIDDRHSYIDIGAWIGPTVLYGSQLAKHCYAIEPDPLNFKLLEDNIRLNPGLNDKITLYNGAIWNKNGYATLGSHGLGYATGSVLKEDLECAINVNCMTFEDFIVHYGIRDCNFVKIDTEGAEIVIMQGMENFIREQKPTIQLSLHPRDYMDLENDSKRILQMIRVYAHIYDTHGNPLSIEDVSGRLMRKEQPTDIVLTDLTWNK
jgi:FkbM family methyltransferase